MLECFWNTGVTLGVVTLHCAADGNAAEVGRELTKMRRSNEVVFRRSASLRGARPALCPKPWNSSGQSVLSPELSTDTTKRISDSRENTISKTLLHETIATTNSGVYKPTGPVPAQRSKVSTGDPKNERQVAKNSLKIDKEDTERHRRKSTPAISHFGNEHRAENGRSHPTGNGSANIATQRSREKSEHHPDKHKTYRRRKRATVPTPNPHSCSSSDYDSGSDDYLQSAHSPRRNPAKDSGSRSKSTPLFRLSVGLNSPVLQEKLQKAIDKRSHSDNNFQKKTRKIRLEGCTYRLTMEPHAATDDETNRIESSSDTESPARSSSLPRERTRSKESDRSKETAFTKRDMKQAQKWMSEREDLARRVNLEKPVRLPSTDDEIQNNNGITDDTPTLLPGVDSREALDCAALRLRRITQELDKGNVTTRILKDTLQYAISVLEMKFLNRTSNSDDDSDADASLQGDSVVPPEIKRWLMQTFSTSGVDTKTKRKGERRTLRSVVHVMQAGMFVERMFRKSSAAANFDIAPEVQNHVKDIDKWHYDIFALEDVSGGHALKYTFYEVLSKYDFIRKYKISGKSLFAFCDRLQIGYRKHNNRYHNPIHAADVTQCISVFLTQSGFVNWLTELEVFAMIFAAAIHDLEHTGTTNNFHIQTRSNLALLYNDKSVLENHHVSAAFRIIWEDPECDILSSLSKDDYKQFRELVIEMVLATDMSLHFGQVKNMKSMLQHPEKMERSKAMSLMMHCADISHPTRPWEQHCRWTDRLIEEFFEQGDKERDLQLPLSPLVDRHSTMVAQSQIGFIDYVIKPTFDVLHDLFWRVSVSVSGDSPSSEEEQNGPSNRRPVSSQSALRDGPSSSSRRYSEATAQSKQATSKAALKSKIKVFRSTVSHCVKCNRQKWVERDKEEQLAKQSKQGNEQNSTESQRSSTDNRSSTT